ncbi:MAG: hypothetical protein KQH53_05940 [Desulfarculaceae bacterium]|nr:hypothetical protein [Desulfarculaceae bacterium]
MNKLQTRIRSLEGVVHACEDAKSAERDAFLRRELDRYLGIPPDTTEEYKVTAPARGEGDRYAVRDPEVRRMLDEFLCQVNPNYKARK